MANHSQQQIETLSNSTRTCCSECIAWLTAFGIEAVAKVTLNALTIIVYLKERSLRKRSMYLVINQAFADMFTGVSTFIHFPIWPCIFEFWTINPPLSDELILRIWVLTSVSHSASIINLEAISLERTHTTFRPFKHRLVKKKIFGAVAAIVWITAGAISTGIVPQIAFKSPFSKRAIKIVYETQSHHRSASSSGRKLTKTLFIVTVVSLLLTLPFFINYLCLTLHLNTLKSFYLEYSFMFMFFSNSLVNPLLYTLIKYPRVQKSSAFYFAL